uniref:Outer spore wall protein RRT8 n=1 Tax=Mycena chlorophos TaxID=658473 RepID=A0ABQ0M3T1_MYCCL|nr:predicted protein [Mycena chlorophos]
MDAFIIDAASTTRDGLLSGAYLYPLLGIYFSVANLSILRSIAPLVLRILLTALGITAALFFFTYLPHVAFCAILGPFAFAAAATMVLGEAYALTTFVCKVFFLDQAQEQLFNAVFRQKGVPLAYIPKGRRRGILQGAFKSVSKPLHRFSREGILRYVVSLPLNLLPVVGTVLFLLYNGAKTGPTFHTRYFHARDMTPSAREAFVQRRQGAYMAFGASALALGTFVPVVGPVFTLTSTVGAALWACDLEKERAKEAARVVTVNAEVPGPLASPIPEIGD